MSRVLTLTALAVFVFGVPNASARKDTTLSFAQCISKAQTYVPGGQLIKARWEKSSTICGCYFYKDGKMHEVEITKNGKLSKYKEQEDTKSGQNIPSDVVVLLGKKTDKAKLPPGRLLELAAESNKGPLTSVKYTVKDDRLLFQANDILLDPYTGKVIK